MEIAIYGKFLQKFHINIYIIFTINFYNLVFIKLDDYLIQYNSIPIMKKLKLILIFFIFGKLIFLKFYSFISKYLGDDPQF